MSQRVWNSRFPRLPVLPAALVTGLALVSGASCSDAGPPPFDPNDIALAYAPREMAASICTRAYDCCTVEQLMSNEAAGTDEASCERLSRDALGNRMDAIARAEHRGRLVYHGDKLASCLANIRAASCDDLRRTNHLSGFDCGVQYLEPKVAVGAACDLDEECIGGSCAVPEGASEGICVVFGGAGESCADGAKCASGFACDVNTHQCHAVAPDGAICSANAECASGSCNKGAAGDSTCGPPPPTMCFYSSGCAAAGAGAPSPFAGVAMILLALMPFAWRGRRRARTVVAQRR